jgi:hypothetical protein
VLYDVLMAEVECPVDGCDYQDSVRSVQGHVTASTNDEHDGLHGMDVAESLREQAEARLNGELPRLDDAVDEARNAVSSAVDGVLTRPGSEEEEPAEPAQGEAGPEPGEEPGEPEVEPVEEIATDDADDTDDGGRSGIPVPVDANYIVIGTALLVVILMLRSGSGSNNSGETDGDDAPTDGVVVQSGGLVG